MTIYGAGPETTSKQLKKSLSETKVLLDLYNEKMPFISQLATACKDAAHREGFFTLFNHARRHFNQWAPGGKLQEGAGPCERTEAERRTRDPSHPWYGQRLWRAETYKALNVLIQSAAAIQTKEWMRACFREGVVPLLQMHDSLDLSVSSPETAEMVARLGGEVIKLEVPMIVDVKYGHTWGDAKHTWAELHAGTSPHVELAGEIPDAPAPTAPETPIFSNDSDDAPKSTDKIPLWEDMSLAVASSTEPPHICIHCRRDPPDGHERASAYNGAWLHPQCEEAFIHARMAEEGLTWQSASFAQTASSRPQTESPSPPFSSSPPSSPPPSGNGRGNGFSGFTAALGHGGNGHATGSKVAADRDAKYAEEHAGEPFSDTDLRAVGYQRTHMFDYTLADTTLLYQQNRYELPKGAKPSKKRPRKKFRPHHRLNGIEVTGAPIRRVIYNWPAIMRAGPGSTAIITEGETNANELIKNGLLATTVLSHDWAPECVAALTGYHLIILQDHDDQGKVLAHAAYKKLAPVAASIRIVPAAHLWKYLPNGDEPVSGDDVQDWIALGGDVTRLLDICREIPADGIITAEPFQ